MAIGDMNTSVASVVWGVAPVFEEASGRKADVRLVDVSKRWSCGEAVVPAPESTFRDQGTVFLCLVSR